MRRRLTPWRLLGWVLALAVVFAWWITLAPGASGSGNGPGTPSPVQRRAP